MLRTFTAFLLSLAIGSAAFAQSTAINGTIEGTVTDVQGALLPGVTVTVTNIDTGDARVVVASTARRFSRSAPIACRRSCRGSRSSSRRACRCAQDKPP
jgi:hypothetical protein